MPFKSQAQERYCRLLESQGRNGTWDCDKWERETPVPISELPERIGNVRGIINKQDIKTAVIVGVAGVLLYRLLNFHIGTNKGKSENTQTTTPPSLTTTNIPSAPSQGLKIGNYILSDKDIENGTSLTYYFRTTEKNPETIFLFAIGLTTKEKIIYLAPFNLIGSMREEKSRIKLKNFLEKGEQLINKLNPNILVKAEFITRGNEPSGMLNTFKTIVEIALRMEKSTLSENYWDISSELRKIYSKWEDKL